MTQREGGREEMWKQAMYCEKQGWINGEIYIKEKKEVGWRRVFWCGGVE